MNLNAHAVISNIKAEVISNFQFVESCYEQYINLNYISAKFSSQL